MGVFKKEPALLGGLIVAVIAVVTIPLPSALQASITGLGAVISSIAVRAIAWSPASVVGAVTDAATKAATATAETLDAVTAAPAGVVSEAGEAVASIAALDAVNTVLKKTGLTK